MNLQESIRNDLNKLDEGINVDRFMGKYQLRTLDDVEEYVRSLVGVDQNHGKTELLAIEMGFNPPHSGNYVYFKQKREGDKIIVFNTIGPGFYIGEYESELDISEFTIHLDAPTTKDEVDERLREYLGYLTDVKQVAKKLHSDYTDFESKRHLPHGLY